MEAVLNALNNINITNIPMTKIGIIFIVLILTQLLRSVVLGVILKGVEHLTSKTTSTLDDELLEVAKPSLNWLVQLGGFWVVKKILVVELGPQWSETIGSALNLIAVFIVAHLLYKASSILGQILSNIVLRTESSLDELIRPLMPKVFQATAIIVFAIKVSEVFLGQSAGALVGLLGGAGLTIGLLFKDVVYDWFCTIIIYSDNLFREGDWVTIEGINGFVQIMRVGFRSTTLHIVGWGSILKMPNSKMISGIVENWSQNPGKELKWGLNLTLKIDGISAQQTARICDAIEELTKSFLAISSSMVRFSKIEQNARVIEIRVFVNDANVYFDIEKSLNIGILELLDKEGIDALEVTLETSPEEFNRSSQAANN